MMLILRTKVVVHLHSVKQREPEHMKESDLQNELKKLSTNTLNILEHIYLLLGSAGTPLDRVMVRGVISMYIKS